MKWKNKKPFILFLLIYSFLLIGLMYIRVSEGEASSNIDKVYLYANTQLMFKLPHQNAIKNHGFEEDFSDWDTYGSVSIDETIYYEGKKSLKAKGGLINEVCQDLPMIPSNNIKSFTVWTRGESLIDQCRVGVYYNDASVTVTTIEWNVINTWEKTEIEYDLDKFITEIWLSGDMWIGFYCWFDDVHLEYYPYHIYIPQFNGRYQNITLNSGMLGLSKGTNAYDIACSTNDNVCINLYKWFYDSHFITEFQPNAETESLLTFYVNTRERGEPKQVTGASSWSFSEDTSILQIQCVNYSRVSFSFLTDAEKTSLWFITRMPTWLGLTGVLLCVISPALTVYFLKHKDLENAAIISVLGTLFGIGLVIGWLWG